MKKIIGVTGGIACGKSTVSNHLKEKGYTVLDADIIAREVVAPNSKGLMQIRQTFGDEYISNGELDRAKMAQKVFSDEKAREVLNDITWPLITEEILKGIEHNDGTIFIDAALLFESGMNRICDEIWLVMADDELRLEWLMNRNRLSEDEARKRMAAQSNLQDKIPLVQRVFYNHGTKEELKEKIMQALAENMEI